MARTTCVWCGVPIEPRHLRCEQCRSMYAWYKRYRKTIFKTSSRQYLLDFRNLCLDMKYNMPGAKRLPDDLDYQFDRVSSYLSGELD